MARLECVLPTAGGVVRSTRERVAMFLYRVGHGAGIRQTACQFDVSEGSVMQVTMGIADLVLRKLLAEYVKWPTPEEQSAISTAWEQEKYLRSVTAPRAKEI